MKFYHIDRAKTLRTGIVFPYPTPPNYCIRQTFPIVSQHGVHYLFHQETETRSVLCEWILEYVRATMFPQMPCRFQSLFVTKTKEEALNWAKYWELNDFNLVEIEAHQFYELDCS